MVVEEPSHGRPGLTDASFVNLAQRGIPVVTADARLYARLVEFNQYCVDFDTYALS